MDFTVAKMDSSYEHFIKASAIKKLCDKAIGIRKAVEARFYDVDKIAS